MPARRSVLALALVALVPATPAPALAPQQVVSYSGGYVPSEIVIVQGDTLTLTNADRALSHDLRSLDTSGGLPLFRSAILGPLQQGNVAGVANLAPSIYPFYCSVHEYMTGNITVLAPPADR